MSQHQLDSHEQNQDAGELNQNEVNVNEFQTCDKALINVMSNNSMKRFIDQQNESHQNMNRSQADKNNFRPHEENNPYNQSDNQSTVKNASSQIIKTAKSLYQFIVPVAQLNLNSQVSVVQNNASSHDMGTTITNSSPVNLNNLQFQVPRHNKSQAMGANQNRFARDSRYASNAGDPLLTHQERKRDLSNTNNQYNAMMLGTVPGASGNSQYQFAQIDGITNYEGGPRSTISSQMPTYMYNQQSGCTAPGQLNFLSYEKKARANMGRERMVKNYTQRNSNYQNEFNVSNQNPTTQRGNMGADQSQFSEDLYQNRVRQVEENKQASSTVVHTFNQIQQDLSNQFSSSKKLPQHFEKLIDHYKLTITIHSVQIDIPQSIKMVVQGIYAPLVCTQDHDVLQVQQTQTEKKCKVDAIKTNVPNSNNNQCLKLADFKNQELSLDIYSESDIQYAEGHLQYFRQRYKAINHNSSKQKCSLKLMAVSDDKQKLIGVYNYHFHSKLHHSSQPEEIFEPLNRQAIKFQKSIDKNASICISTDLQPVKLYTQEDYDEIFNNLMTKTKLDPPFVSADNMGSEGHVSGEHASKESAGSNERSGSGGRDDNEASPVRSQEHKKGEAANAVMSQKGNDSKAYSQRSNNGNSKKKGINKINTSNITAMKLRGPSAADTAKSQSGLNANSTEGRKDREDSRTKVEPAETVATVHHRNESGLNEENQGSKSDTQNQAEDARCRPQSAAQPQTQSIKHENNFDSLINKIASPQPKLDLTNQHKPDSNLQSPDADAKQQENIMNSQNQDMNENIQQIDQNYQQPFQNFNQNQQNSLQYPNDGQENEPYQQQNEANDNPLKTTMNMLFERLQVGVHSVKKALNDNQNEYLKAASMRRSQSSNQPLNRYRGLETNRNLDDTLLQVSYKREDEPTGQPLRIDSIIQQIRSPQSNITLENCAGRPPMPNMQNQAHQLASARGTSNPRQLAGSRGYMGSGPAANDTFPVELRNTSINERSLQNEVDTLKQEKKFLQTRLESQQNQYEEQIKLLHEKIHHQQKKYNKRKQSVTEMKMRLEQQMENYIEIQQRNETEFKDEYEYMIHLYSQNNQLKEMFEQKFHESANARQELEAKLKAEEELRKASLNQAQDEAQRADDEKQEAYEQKISIQQEEIEALLNEKQDNTKTIQDKEKAVKSKDEKIDEMQKQIEQLQQQLQQKEEKHTIELKNASGESALQEKELSVLKQKYQENEEKNMANLTDLGGAKADLEHQVQELKKTVTGLEGTLATKQDQILQKDKQLFRLQNDMEQSQKVQNQRQQEAGKSLAVVDDLREQNEDLIERLRFTESQLIQVKSSWAESEHEREQFFNQIQDQEERIFTLTEQIENHKQTIASLVNQNQKSSATLGDGQKSTNEEENN